MSLKLTLTDAQKTDPEVAEILARHSADDVSIGISKSDFTVLRNKGIVPENFTGGFLVSDVVLDETVPGESVTWASYAHHEKLKDEQAVIYTGDKCDAHHNNTRSYLTKEEYLMWENAFGLEGLLTKSDISGCIASLRKPVQL